MGGKVKKKPQIVKPVVSVLPHSEAIQVIYHPMNVMMLSFDSVQRIKACLGRPHVSYEGSELRGPLKGVNFPIEHLLKWSESLDLEVSDDERYILDLIHDSYPKTKYLLAYLSKDASTLLHEWAHAVYHLDEGYRELSHRCWDALDKESKVYIEKELKLRNYREDVYVDEFQAYIVEGPYELGKKVASRLQETHRLLKTKLGQVPKVN